jgi:hypothetical protein
MGLPDQWIYQGERRDQLVEAGIDASNIARTIRAVVEAAPKAARASTQSTARVS